MPDWNNFEIGQVFFLGESILNSLNASCIQKFFTISHVFSYDYAQVIWKVDNKQDWILLDFILFYLFQVAT